MHTHPGCSMRKGSEHLAISLPRHSKSSLLKTRQSCGLDNDYQSWRDTGSTRSQWRLSNLQESLTSSPKPGRQRGLLSRCSRHLPTKELLRLCLNKYLHLETVLLGKNVVEISLWWHSWRTMGTKRQFINKSWKDYFREPWRLLKDEVRTKEGIFNAPVAF